MVCGSIHYTRVSELFGPIARLEDLIILLPIKIKASNSIAALSELLTENNE